MASGTVNGLGRLRFPEEYVDIIGSGTVRGAEAACTPDDVTVLLGEDSFEDVTEDHRFRSYGSDGIVEFWWRRPEDDGLYFSVKPFRLEEPLSMAVLLRAAEAAGCPLEFQGGESGWVRYLRAESGIQVTGWEDGAEVYSLFSGGGTPPSYGPRWSRQAMKGSLAFLLDVDGSGRRRWLERRVGDPERPEWWWRVLGGVCEGLMERGGPQERGKWLKLRLWLARSGGAYGVVGAEEAAMELSYVTHRLYADGVFDADEAVRACLAALPVAAPAQVPTRGTTVLARENLEAMRLSRRVRVVVEAAAPHLGRVRDPAVRAELAAWVGLRERLF
ncbi:hypothetical protein [Streptomyces purpureus]|uniref:hypothetical protein n=1 Tax=Streptomyces purpureus TaxID=1951 RepID=UPI00037ECBF7|nr:hypothetical protein [Streptomyces purpureus]